MNRQKPALRERRLTKPAVRRSGIVAYPTARRSPVEADGESEKLAASAFRPANGFYVHAVSGRGGFSTSCHLSHLRILNLTPAKPDPSEAPLC